MDVSRFEQIIGYRFKDQTLLKTALTHSSAINKKKTTSNQRLEFLGDAVLQLIISTYLYRELEEQNEGSLSKLRSLIVCTDSLFVAAEDILLKEFIILGKGEELSGGRDKKNIIADAFEALIGAVYMDDGYKTADRFVQDKLESIIKEALHGQLTYDYKTMLQEYVQSENLGELKYELVKVSGPEHEQVFYSCVVIDGKCYQTAKGPNRKQSEQNAAEIVLKKHKVIVQ